MYFDGLLASHSFQLRLPMPKISPDHLCPCRVHVWLRWQKWSGNVLTPSDVLVKGGRNSASMQSKDIGSGVEVHKNGPYWVGWSESPKQVLSDGHVVERCGVLDEFILILIWSSKEIKEINFCSTRTSWIREKKKRRRAQRSGDSTTLNNWPNANCIQCWWPRLPSGPLYSV